MGAGGGKDGCVCVCVCLVVSYIVTFFLDCSFVLECGRHGGGGGGGDGGNGLSNQVVSAKTIESLKRKLDKDKDGHDKWK